MSFPSSLQKKCLEIITDLMAHPIAEVFMVPVDPVRDGVPDYFDIIKNPSDFTTIKNKLIEGRYLSYDEFKRDVNLIWENAITFNSKQSLPAYIADELNKEFQKKIWCIENPPAEQWINDFLKHRLTLCKLFRNPPSGLANFAFTPETALFGDSEQTSNKHLSAEDSKFFNENIEYLRDPKNAKTIEKVIHDIEPSFVFKHETLFDDLAKMLPRTRRALKNHIMEEASKPAETA